MPIQPRLNHEIEPVYNDESEILILGTFPSSPRHFISCQHYPAGSLYNHSCKIRAGGFTEAGGCSILYELTLELVFIAGNAPQALVRRCDYGGTQEETFPGAAR